MSEEQAKFLWDMQLAIENIRIHLQDKLDYRLFEQKVTIRSAVKYEFAVIG